MKLFKNWLQRYYFSSGWMMPDKYSDDLPKPLLSFSLEWGTFSTLPYVYFSSNDTNRWRGVWFDINISRYNIHIGIPLMRLPDSTIERDGSGKLIGRLRAKKRD